MFIDDEGLNNVLLVFPYRGESHKITLRGKVAIVVVRPLLVEEVVSRAVELLTIINL